MGHTNALPTKINVEKLKSELEYSWNYTAYRLYMFIYIYKIYAYNIWSYISIHKGIDPCYTPYEQCA